MPTRGGRLRLVAAGLQYAASRRPRPRAVRAGGRADRTVARSRFVRVSAGGRRACVLTPVGRKCARLWGVAWSARGSVAGNRRQGV